MNIVEEYFWQADMAFQSNRLNESCQYICQAIEHLDQPKLTLEQLELLWTVIPKMITHHTRSIERLVHHHQSMPIETDECFDRSVQNYVRRLEEDQADRCWKFIHCFDANLIQEKKDIDHIHLHRLQADLYLQLSYVSRQ
ncbi:unnamed protein product [Adineta ricciae]|uniref:Uncharacterized protein n=2 Tax=Adineta ricciae TaxID=249248 RepID=A0A814LLE3_ADIRI|nr:unnamed protein product [Adineta ricciae]